MTEQSTPEKPINIFGWILFIIAFFIILGLYINSKRDKSKLNAEEIKETIKTQADSITDIFSGIIYNATINGVPMKFGDSLRNVWLYKYVTDTTGALAFIEKTKKLLVIEKTQSKIREAASKRNEAAFMANFSYSKDDFDAVGFYTHKYWKNNGTRNKLYCYVNSNGFPFLVSHYYGSDLVMHEGVTVLIGGVKYESQTIPTYDKDNVTEISDGKFTEVVTYTDSYDIIRHIAENQNETIKVRFSGRQHYFDIVLSSWDKKAFKETNDLHLRLKEE